MKEWLPPAHYGRPKRTDSLQDQIVFELDGDPEAQVLSAHWHVDCLDLHKAFCSALVLKACSAFSLACTQQLQFSDQVTFFWSLPALQIIASLQRKALKGTYFQLRFRMSKRGQNRPLWWFRLHYLLLVTLCSMQYEWGILHKHLLRRDIVKNHDSNIPKDRISFCS